jgi:hypothetical protein
VTKKLSVRFRAPLQLAVLDLSAYQNFPYGTFVRFDFLAIFLIEVLLARETSFRNTTSNRPRRCASDLMK